MSKEMIYPTRDQEYQLAGWLGTIQIMQEAGAAVIDNDLYPHLQDRTMGTYALRFCVNLYQKPDQFRGVVDRLFRNGVERDDDDSYRLALRMIGAAELVAGKVRLVQTFADALDLSTDGGVISMVQQETDFFRLEDAIAGEVAFNRRFIPRIIENRDTDAYLQVQREIDFGVGLNDPSRS